MDRPIVKHIPWMWNLSTSWFSPELLIVEMSFAACIGLFPSPLSLLLWGGEALLEFGAGHVHPFLWFWSCIHGFPAPPHMCSDVTSGQLVLTGSGSSRKAYIWPSYICFYVPTFSQSYHHTLIPPSTEFRDLNVILHSGLSF